MSKSLTIIGLSFITLLLVFFLGRCSNVPETITTIKTITKIDTQYIIKHDTFLFKGKGITKYIEVEIENITPSEIDSLLSNLKNSMTFTAPIRIPHSNLFITGGFSSKVDTILNQDTLNLAYYFPNAYFEVMLRRRPDTSSVVTIDKIITKEIEKPKAWHENPYVRAGFGSALLILGIFIGK